MMRRYFFWTMLAVVVGISTAYSLNELVRTAYYYLTNSGSAINYASAGLFNNLPNDEATGEPVEIPARGKLIFADLVALKLVLYENGVEINSFPILAKGKRGTPWETPPGKYAVLAKNAKSFSAIDKVWLPSEVKFSGNFAIHGRPYAQSGRALPSTFAGGCIRLDNAGARDVYNFADLETPVIVSDFAGGDNPNIQHYEVKTPSWSPAISAKAYLLADLDSGEILESKSTTTVYPIASVSKLMTALVSLEKINQKDLTTLSKRAIATEGSSGNLKVGEKLEVGNLLYPLLLASSNDAAEAIAEHYGRDAFLKLMNEKAKALGLDHTSFEDPSGLSPHNVSTAEDLYKLARYIYSHEPYIFEVSAKLGHTTVEHSWFNQNDLAAAAYFLGGKNGFTDEARQTMVSLWSIPFSKVENRRLVLVELNSADRKTDAEKLLKNLRQTVSFEPRQVAEPALLADKIMFASTTLGALGNIKVQTPLTLAFVGDIMLDRGVEQSVMKKGQGDFSWLLQNVKDLSLADVLFGNLEGPVSDQGKDLGNKYSFRMAPAALEALAKFGFDALSVTNNHVGDWGVAAFSDTLNRLSKTNILAVGGGSSYAEASRVKIIGKNGYRIGFLSASDVGPNWLAAGEDKPGIILASDKRWPELIKKAANQVDILVVSYHFGNEYEREPTERQRYLAQLAIDSGARIVVGHHPHVVQTVEKYKNGIIAYSLGNFIFDQYFSDSTMMGLLLTVKFEGSEIAEARGIYTTLNAEYQPSLQTKDEE